MANIAKLEARLQLYEECERAILRGNQSYSVDGMTYSKADLGKVQKMIAELDARLQAARRGQKSGFYQQRVFF